ncbi:MAG: SGNH/GDSL hydrolase family protein [Stackebrandtia sp.]
MSPFSRRVCVGLVAAVVSFGALSTPAQAAEPSRYVALGDSFVSGPLIPNQTGSPLGCFRSDSNYPSLVAEALAVDEFVDVSCGGAQTVDMFEPQDTGLGVNPPQLDALDANTTLVTLGISGNDIGFADILLTCLAPGVLDPLGSPCQDLYTDPDTGEDELRQRIADAEADVVAVVEAIAERAPNAQVVFTGYLALLPESKGCWPIVPIAEGDVPYLDGVEHDLNAMIEGVSDAYGAQFVDVFERGHDMCAGHSERWVEGIIPTNPAFVVHPNANGMAHVAERVVSDLG